MTEVLHHSPTLESNTPRIEYLFDETESTALDSVFNLLFELLEKEVSK